jgi:F-type H+-transporting ATPase subunit b
MKAFAGRSFLGRFGGLIIRGALLGAYALPTLAQESSPDAASMTMDTVFRWLNFLLVFGAIAYVIAKVFAPYFRTRAQGIAKSIDEASQSRAAAEREFQEAAQKLATVESGIEQERRTAVRESAADRERIRALTRTEIDKIGQAARAEIAAAERAGAQELRAIAAGLATERAAALIQEQMNDAAEEALFDAFVGELERAAP